MDIDRRPSTTSLGTFLRSFPQLTTVSATIISTTTHIIKFQSVASGTCYTLKKNTYYKMGKKFKNRNVVLFARIK